MTTYYIRQNVDDGLWYIHAGAHKSPMHPYGFRLKAEAQDVRWEYLTGPHRRALEALPSREVQE